MGQARAEPRGHGALLESWCTSGTRPDSPGAWADDWWVPLGKLAKGTYSGWVREQVVSDYPTWMDESGAIVTDPIWLPKYNTRWAHTFTVK